MSPVRKRHEQQIQLEHGRWLPQRRFSSCRFRRKYVVVLLLFAGYLLCLLLAMHRLDVTLSSSSNHVLSYFLREAKHPIQQSPNSTLALLSPPGLLGGYRNQVLRWMAFVLYAKQHELEQIFLPSILWSTQIVTSTNNVSKWYPIPMEWVFDVEFWNQFHPQLPLLISEPLHNSDCWEMPRTIVNITLNPLQQAALERGYLHPLKNIATQQLKEFNPRKQDFLPLVQHCQHPVVYGGGIQAGRLWNDYLEYTKKKSTLRKELSQIDEWVYRALRPAPQWRAVAQQCVPTPHYAVLHARLEMDMMAHVCGIDMERNLTQILQQVATVLETNYSQVTGLVIAVSRAGMMAPKQSSERQAHAQHNLKTLNRLVREGWRVGSRQVQVLECGERLVQEYYEAHPDIVDHGSLLHSVVNFDLALNADVFIGVRSSSYSTDVLTSRYYMGKGDHNYRYTKTDHIEKVKGLPEPHANCARKRKQENYRLPKLPLCNSSKHY